MKTAIKYCDFRINPIFQILLSKFVKLTDARWYTEFIRCKGRTIELQWRAQSANYPCLAVATAGSYDASGAATPVFRGMRIHARTLAESRAEGKWVVLRGVSAMYKVSREAPLTRMLVRIATRVANR